ncbi:MAG: DUF2865 domain-containing protein [Pseudomonadota bacterium]
MVSRRLSSTAASRLREAKPLLDYLAVIAVVLGATVYAAMQGLGALGGVAQTLTSAGDEPVTESRVLDSFAQESFIYRGPPKPKTNVAPPSSFAGLLFASPPGAAGPATAVPDEQEDGTPQSVATYRTVCVRLCDGYYFPISYATTPAHFAKDAAKCEASCGSPVRLYVYENPGSESETMEDLSGRPYSELKTAFLYRTEYVPSCSCKAQPWEQEALDKHRVYALAQSEQKLWTDMSKAIAAERKVKRPKAAVNRAVAELKTETAAQSAALKAEMKDLEEKIASQEANRKEAALAVVAAKGIDVARGNRTRFASKRWTKPKAVAPMVAAPFGDTLVTPAAAGAAPVVNAPAAAAPPPASWDPPMALGGSKSRSKIWGNGPNAHAAPRGTGAGDEFRRNFY